MAASHNFIIKWTIDNVPERLAPGKKEETGVCTSGGFKWKATFDQNPRDPYATDFNLFCGYEGHGAWKCETEVELKFQHEARRPDRMKKITFDYGRRAYTIDTVDFLIEQGYWSPNDKIVLLILIKIMKSEFPLNLALINLFPNGIDNVTLVIGGKKVRVCKEYLAVHSPVLAVLFFGDFAEKGKEEIEIKDVIYEEFLDLLYVIYLGMMEVTDYTVPHILKLGDRFQMERVLIQSAKHLIKSERFDTVQKLIFSDQYRLASLKDHCLKSLSNNADLIEELKSSPEYANLSVDMKAAIESENEV